MQFNKKQVALLFVVCTQTPEGKRDIFPIEKQEVALATYKKLQSLVTSTPIPEKDLVSYEFAEGDIEFSTEEKAFLLERLRRPFDLDTIELKDDVTALLK